MRTSYTVNRTASLGDIWVTERRVRRVSFSWRLDRAALLFCRDLHRRSIEFHAPNDPDVVWTMYLLSPPYYPHNSKLELPNKVNVSIRYYSKYDPFVYVRPFLCPNEQRQVEATKESEDYKFLLEKKKTFSIGRGLKVVIDTKRIDPDLDYHDIKLTLVYMGRLLKPRRVSVPVSTLRLPPIGIAADLEKLLGPECDIPADLTIYVEGKEMQAHRAILSARSPVFQAMFRSDMIEAKTGRVSLSEIKAEVCSAMLQYMYSGRVYPITCSLADLLAAADRFAIADLKTACEAELIVGLSVETAYDALCLHDKYTCPKLRKEALNVLRAKILEAVRMPWWDHMIKNDPHILADIIEISRMMTA